MTDVFALECPQFLRFAKTECCIETTEDGPRMHRHTDCFNTDISNATPLCVCVCVCFHSVLQSD